MSAWVWYEGLHEKNKVIFRSWVGQPVLMTLFTEMGTLEKDPSQNFSPLCQVSGLIGPAKMVSEL